MKSLLTSYYADQNNNQSIDSSAQKTPMYIMESGSHAQIVPGNESSSKSIGMKYRTSVGVSEAGSSRSNQRRNLPHKDGSSVYNNGFSPKGPKAVSGPFTRKQTQKGAQKKDLESYVVSLEQEVLNLRTQLKKALDESKQMKRINKDLLDQLNLAERSGEKPA